MKNDIQVLFDDYSVEFSGRSGGFPTRLTQLLRNDRESTVISSEKPWLELELTSGDVAYPEFDENVSIQKNEDEEGNYVISFGSMPLRTSAGMLSDWMLSLEYELHKDGVGFCQITLINDGCEKPDVKDLRLVIPIGFGDDQSCLYQYWLRPEAVDGGAIQSYSELYRNEISARERMEFNGTILPFVGYDFGKPGRLFRHIEWITEESNSLDEENPQNSKTILDWNEKGPVLTYSFAPEGVKAKGYPYVWSNRFGFVISQIKKVRDKAPLRLYHEVDGYFRYPTDEQIGKMASEGADMLILHESWRRNMRNGGIPYSEHELIRVIDTCHKYGIRVAPYIRGNEDSVRESACSWFDRYFTKDLDGLYVDYGSPHGFFEKNPIYTNGRIAFHTHYHTISALRERVGRDGILILHEGPFFCGSVLTSLIDGFCSGECEQGKMIEDRSAHAYYSKSSLGPGSLWTAAFPSYRTEKIIPYAAVSGQFPHVSLGIQIASSSLANPSEPGNVIFMRPLWKYFGLLKDERNVLFSNDICDDGFICDSPETGVGFYKTGDGSRLWLIANFRGFERECSVSGEGMLREGTRYWLLNAGAAGTEAKKKAYQGELKAILKANEVIGILECDDNEKWSERLNEFLKPYPVKDKRDSEYEDLIEEMRRLRFDTVKGREVYLKMHIPFSNPTWEKPLFDDLYETTLYRLFVTDNNGKRTELGYIGRDGITKEIPNEGSRPWPGEDSVWIELHRMLPPGGYDFEIHAYRMNEDYYSLCEALIKTDSNDEPVVLTYMGELDEDRSRLTFHIDLK
ncbi:MAG: hypothetical protein Q4B67_07500 [Eubacteriales bacterium]|nr:hypothetical protein [Eubacteriales bacterium]